MSVKTQIIKVKPKFIEQDKIKIIAKVLKEEGIIVYPTDTFYGLGACCFSEKMIQRIYYLKKRKASKPLSVVISEMDEVENIAVDIPPLFWELSSEFWPGPLTLVLKASSKLPKILLGSQDSIGIRLPAFPWLRALVREAAFPITATSANISGEEESTNPEKILDSFHRKVDLFIDGGILSGVLPSTVIDLLSRRPKVLREGAVPHSLLEKYL